ncbi:Lysosomal alpha-mannosidase [Hypsibius exemplaris]|uniref:Alpha-mannosidase n=1 Tax=Hypsibius exemplaris TaxID=2072580 RepID=A0A1W0WMU0_HYPEX|nr:Lysosomal alpha-mannosidase [Hypsibius exemplaris]
MELCLGMIVLCFVFGYGDCRSHRDRSPDDPYSSTVCGYESCPKGTPGQINVHLISHTHDDVGWLKTIDQYYYGAKSDIQIAGVQYILDSVVDALLDDPSRRFIYVETAFFWKWWLQQDDLMHHTVHRLVKEGRLEFISGAWSMNDEAVCHYSSIIENFAWGLRKLNDTFGACGRPKIGWQIDPFGHSREQAALFAMLGFDGLFLGRIDYQDIEKRRKTKTMEMIWEGSDSLGKMSDIFTGILPNVYWPPSTFCFDLLCNDPPIMDDPRLEDYNVVERVATFMEVVNNQSLQYKTDNLIITMGNDFNYQNAHVWFKNLDKLIKYVNAKQTNGSKINLFYSTPSCYLNALHQANASWPTKDDDFFPYASGEHTVWSGYYTSRPALKRMEREASAFLLTCKQIDALAQLGPADQHDVSALRDAVSVAQHHDAVTGTERQHVADDYALRLDRGVKECQETVVDGINRISNVTKPLQFEFCDLLNISICSITENSKEVALVLWNPLSRTLNHYVQLPVVDGDYDITGPGGTKIPFQITPLPKHTLLLPGRLSNATHEILFRAKLPPLGYTAYNLKKLAKGGVSLAGHTSILRKRASGFADDDFVIKNEFLALTFDQSSGSLKYLTNLETNTTISISQTFAYYVGSVGNNTKEPLRASGAYIFRPNCTGAGPDCSRPLEGNGTYEIVKGPLVQEVRQYICAWVSQVIRLHATSKKVHFEWQVGPIPVGDGIGKEIVSRFSTNLKSGTEFFTDSNGRQNIKRRRNFRPSFNLNLTEPISSNFYPVVDRIFIQDETAGSQLTILTDRAQAGSSLLEGQIELMVHRRLLVDDWLGVSEPLNEPGLGEGLVVRGSHHLIFTNIAKSPRRHRLASHDLYWHPALLLLPVSSTTSQADLNRITQSAYSGLSVDLPVNIHILSIEQWKGSSLIVRLEHFFEKDEDPVLSQPAVVNLKDILRDFVITSVREMTLDGNVALTDVHRLQWSKVDQEDYGTLGTDASKIHRIPHDIGTTFTLNPMEIRTFQIEIGPSL